MGAYLSTPITDKKSLDYPENKKYICGLSGMQGWRLSMEDAYNCEPQIGEDTGFFAVYDGHGGGEVAMYCSHHFVEILKSMETYKTGDINSALSQTYMEIDKKLKEPRVIKELKLLSQMDPGDPPVTEEDIKKMEKREKEEKEEEADETRLLYEEATMSIEALLAKYGRVVNETEQKMKELHSEEASPGLSKEVKEEIDNCDNNIKKPDEREASEEKSSDTSQTSKTQNNEDVSSAQDSNESLNKIDEEVKKKLRKTFPKTKPVKLDEEEEDSDDDDDYDGFESDEAMGGSSDDDDDDDGDDDDDDDDDELSDEEESEKDSTGKNIWTGENEKKEDERRAGESTVEEPGCDSGTTAVVAVLRDTELYVANAGDSRCVLCRKDGVAFDMSNDHKPEDEAELARITNAGGHVNLQGRVNGGLNLSRALGDHLYKANADLPLEKQMITALPDVRHVTLEPGDDFMVIACDGIWNVMNSQEVVDFVRYRLTSNNPEEAEEKDEVQLSKICEELFHKCLAEDTTGDGTGCDNMTCIIVRFKPDWIAERHQARRKPPPSSHSDGLINNKQTVNDADNDSCTAKGDSVKADVENKLNKKHQQEIIAEKRSLSVANDTEGINGENKASKRAKVE